MPCFPCSQPAAAVTPHRRQLQAEHHQHRSEAASLRDPLDGVSIGCRRACRRANLTWLTCPPLRAGESLRSKSEPASRTRDSRRRRNFYMEEASYDDHFINPDLETRAQIFNSEEQVGAARTGSV